MDGVFVTATDTEVGKTTVAAGILKLLQGNRPAYYWKPVQTGTIVGDDTKDVLELTELEQSSCLEPGYRFPEPSAPYQAAKSWNQPISIDRLVSLYQEARLQERFIIVEGAGGLLVPLTEQYLLIELIKRLELPVVIISPDRLGTINQTLLTVNALRAANISVLGVIMTRSHQSEIYKNAESIEKYGQVEILAKLEESIDRKAVVSQVSCHPKLRALFGAYPLPT